MKTNNYKYVVSIGTDIFPNLKNYDDFDYEPIRSTYEEIEFSENNLIEARKQALERAKSHIIVFEAQPHNIPTWKWNTTKDLTKKHWMLYQIKVFLKGDTEDLYIYDDGDGLNDEEIKSEIFENLLREYEIFENAGIETNQSEISVFFKDWEKPESSEKSEANILPNGMDWSDIHINYKSRTLPYEELKEIYNDEPEVKQMTLDEFKSYMDNKKTSIIKKEIIQKASPNRTNKKIEFKTTSIHRIKLNHENIEISVKTTSEIPKEIQNELISLIDKWKNL